MKNCELPKKIGMVDTGSDLDIILEKGCVTAGLAQQDLVAPLVINLALKNLNPDLIILRKSCLTSLRHEQSATTFDDVSFLVGHVERDTRLFWGHHFFPVSICLSPLPIPVSLVTTPIVHCAITE